MKPGTQIAYVPNHAAGDINHPDVEFGFVTSEHQWGKGHWCRYWLKGKPGVLRTTSASEKTPTENLVEHVSVSQAHVDALVSGFQAEAALSGA